MSIAVVQERPTLGLYSIAAIVSLATLPFMQSLTVQAGFPVKIYEVMLLSATAVLPFFGHLIFPRSAIPMARITAIWMLLTSLLLIVNIAMPPISMSELGIESRFGAAGDGITKLVYLWLNLLGFLLFARLARHNEELFVKAWLFGAMMAASYEFYLIAANLAGIVEPPMLPNSKGVTFGIGSHLFQRAATFTEGNYAGLYFVLSLIIALHAKYRRLSVVMTIAAITSFSTTAFIVLCGLGAYFAWRQMWRMRPITRFFLAPVLILCIGVMGAGVAATAVFQATVTNKLTAGSETGEALSRVERLRAAEGAWQMFLDNPVTGVGTAQFGYNIQYYQPSRVLHKQIANVVYLELLAENGIIVFLIFLGSMWVMFKRTWMPGERFLRIGLIGLVFCFLAAPTISIMFLWGFFGLICGRQRGPFGGVEQLM